MNKTCRAHKSTYGSLTRTNHKTIYTFSDGHLHISEARHIGAHNGNLASSFPQKWADFGPNFFLLLDEYIPTKWIFFADRL